MKMIHCIDGSGYRLYFYNSTFPKTKQRNPQILATITADVGIHNPYTFTSISIFHYAPNTSKLAIICLKLQIQ